MRTARSSSRRKGSPPGTPLGSGTPLGPDPLGPDPQDQTPLDQAPHPHWTRHPPYGQAHTCKHITLPQTSFAGGHYLDSFRKLCRSNFEWALEMA